MNRADEIESADKIATFTGSKTHRIEPAVAYTSADLDYNNSSSRANREQNDPSARPAIGNTLEGLSNCDVIFLGYPIWWGKAPKAYYQRKLKEGKHKRQVAYDTYTARRRE